MPLASLVSRNVRLLEAFMHIRGDRIIVTLAYLC